MQHFWTHENFTLLRFQLELIVLIVSNRGEKLFSGDKLYSIFLSSFSPFSFTLFTLNALLVQLRAHKCIPMHLIRALIFTRRKILTCRLVNTILQIFLRLHSDTDKSLTTIGTEQVDGPALSNFGLAKLTEQNVFLAHQELVVGEVYLRSAERKSHQSC